MHAKLKLLQRKVATIQSEVRTMCMQGDYMNNAKQTFWQNVVEFGKTVLAHVNINYDGSTGAIRIDILPTEFQGDAVSKQTQSIPQHSNLAILIDHREDSRNSSDFENKEDEEHYES